jgi:hypothetical protein
VAYVVGHLHSKCQALITNLNTAKRKKRGRVKKKVGGENGKRREVEGKGRWKGRERDRERKNTAGPVLARNSVEYCFSRLDNEEGYSLFTETFKNSHESMLAYG